MLEKNVAFQRINGAIVVAFCVTGSHVGKTRSGLASLLGTVGCQERQQRGLLKNIFGGGAAAGGQLESSLVKANPLKVVGDKENILT